MPISCGAATGTAGYGEKSALRTAQRNGYREQGLGDAGRNGRTAHPQAQKGLLLAIFLEPRRMAEKALAAVIQV
ncbi:hypothetical protein X762_30660 [Mesorhizobium sp. LSHC426A00]|nr:MULTISPECIES: hypothetical protein [unclassified Mesorhizobium]ESX41196.1 hypothetical protein X762_30660 [Mesorhizobium sp. LSHC426A00]ESX48470.1 hypothetical protein X761_28315 [Mesorhizobium sp. LSHC424B00]ESX65367.1 hypothetical protein X758_29885 [Mesorhizobium sp. LSHC416B00]